MLIYSDSGPLNRTSSGPVNVPVGGKVLDFCSAIKRYVMCNCVLVGELEYAAIW